MNRSIHAPRKRTRMAALAAALFAVVVAVAACGPGSTQAPEMTMPGASGGVTFTPTGGPSPEMTNGLGY